MGDWVNTTFVISRCPKKQRVLLGGLGFSGNGVMWCDEKEYHQGYKGYAEAEILDDAPDGPFDHDIFLKNLGIKQ